MKVTNKVTLELTQAEAKELARFLPDNIYEADTFLYQLREEICKELNIKSWDL